MAPQRRRSVELADRIFLTVIALIMLGLIAASNFTAGVSKENRMLTKRPVLFSNGAVNRQIIKDFDNYIADRFGFRDMLVDWNAYISVSIFGVSSSEKVLIGKNNFMFYVSKFDGDNLSDFLKINRLNPQQLLAIKTKLEEKAAWCEKNGIKFIFVAAPSKHSIYSEYYPFARPGGPSRLDQIINYMNTNSGTKVVDLRPALIKAKKDNLVYLEADSHWNERGAYIASDVILKELKAMFPRTRFGESVAYVISSKPQIGGDLSILIGDRKYGRFTNVSYEPKTDYPYAYEKSDGKDPIITVHSDQSLPEAILFRDSFFTAVQPFTSTLFSRATYRWKIFQDVDKKMILEEKPDVIIFEVAERFMQNLAFLD